ncbi:MAG TPA: hypothetical protein VHR41_09085 [Gemmatimonadales bacterium]|jgi:hypothetical protein|nr:hypothetical protein [Gemmatimonadales bacterium]
MRVFVNATPVEIDPGTTVRGAVRAHDPALELRLAAGSAYVTDARAIEVAPDSGLMEGAILRVVSRAPRSGGDDADA